MAGENEWQKECGEIQCSLSKTTDIWILKISDILSSLLQIILCLLKPDTNQINIQANLDFN